MTRAHVALFFVCVFGIRATPPSREEEDGRGRGERERERKGGACAGQLVYSVPVGPCENRKLLCGGDVDILNPFNVLCFPALHKQSLFPRSPQCLAFRPKSEGNLELVNL